MVKISPELLVKYASHTKKRTNETDAQYLKRLTHIYFQERNIDEIDNLSCCKNLSVLYLYDNAISKIKNLDFAVNLTHLYLQKNKITHLSGFRNLINLTKLYLGQNHITVVEGLESNTALTELHIENQSLPPGEKLLFDPRTIESLSKSLSILNISSNNIEDVTDLQVLRKLNHLMISDNNISNWSSLSDGLLSWASLFKLDLAGNPICQHKKHRDKLIIISKSLVMIDDKEVSESNRQFLQNWYAKKEAKKQMKKQLREKSESYGYMANDKATDSLALKYPYSYDTLYKLQESSLYQQSQQKYISKNQKQFEEILAKARDMKSLPPLEQRARYPVGTHYSLDDSPIIHHVMNENKP